MIRYFSHNQIDKQAWDNCIKQAVNGNICAYSWYLDIVSPGWCALIENDFKAIMPLPVASRLGVRYLRQPYFSQQSGVFYSQSPEKIQFDEFIKIVKKKFRYIDINLNSLNVTFFGGHTSNLRNLELELKKSYLEIYEDYSHNLKRNLQKAKDYNLLINKQVSVQELIELFRQNRGAELRNLGSKQYKAISLIAEKSILKGVGEIMGVKNPEGELLAAALWVEGNGKVVFLFSGLSIKGKSCHAMPLLIDNFIREHAGMDLIFDFEGSNQPGLARFYSSFGAKEVNYMNLTFNNLPPILKIMLQLWRMVRDRIKM